MNNIFSGVHGKEYDGNGGDFFPELIEE